MALACGLGLIVRWRGGAGGIGPLAHAAHELRTPLAVLDVQLQTALRGDIPAEQALQDLRRTVQWAVAVTEQALGEAAACAPGGGCRVDDVLHTLALEVSPLIADKDLAFRFDALPAAVRAPEWRLRGIFSNLLANAIRHAPDRGKLEILMGREADGSVRVVVWNSGRGIDETLRRKLFLPFRSGPGGSGVGLGLALCRRHVGLLGGRIILRNATMGCGVEAVVLLPAIVLR